MTFRAASIAIALLALVVSATPGEAGDLYVLTSQSTYTEGCVEPCRCPLISFPEATGTFVLEPDGEDPEFELFAVRDLKVTVVDGFGAVAHTLTGSGTYRIDKEGRRHEMELEVSVDGEPPTRLTSGLVDDDSGFPRIALEVSQGTECFDLWLGLDAAPAEVYSMGRDSTVSWGCVPPCLCPVQIAPTFGSYLLAEVDPDPLFQNYELRDIDWTVPMPSGATARLSGSGTYRIGGEVEPSQQLTLDLRLNGGPVQRLDSGLQFGGLEFPRIELVANRGTDCFDVWVDMDAAPADRYELSDSSLYYEGCVEPCRCPVQTAAMKGEMFLIPAENDGQFERFTVDYLEFSAPEFDGVGRRLVGDGSYAIGFEVLEQSIELELRIDDVAEKLSSGTVAADGGFPESLSIGAERGAECFDIWMDIEARRR